jgi:ABC-type transport system involved in multi-copper enzyme maturation permease subunit
MSVFTALTLETLRDGLRRRGLIAALVASALAAFAVQRCGSCDAAVTLQGRSVTLQGGELGALVAVTGLAWIAAWTYAVSTLLASDGLATALEDGSAASVLARPVARDTFVLTRLAGIWLGSFALGAALAALAVGLAVARQHVPLAPGLGALVALGLGTWSVVAAAMLASLSLPRPATLLLVIVAGAAVSGIEVAALLGARTDGFAGLVAQWGPAWIAAPVDALAPWLASPLPGPPPWPLVRALAWAALVTAALVARFRRLEIPL